MAEATSAIPARRVAWRRLGAFGLGKIGHALIVLWITFTITFLLLYLMPGDAALARLGDEASMNPEALAALRETMGLNRPLHMQYLSQIMSALRGDLGVSLLNGQPVSRMILDALPQTAMIAGLALALSIVVGTLLALVAALTQIYWVRSVLLSIPSFLTSVPTFWTGLLLLMIFSYRLQWLPAFGSRGVEALILPVVVLAIVPTALIAQVLATSLIDSKAAAYAQTAYNKGAGSWRVLIAHCMRNSVIPALTLIGMISGNLLSGSVIVETIFSRSGIGRVMIEAVQTVDLPVVQGIVLFCALVFVVMNLLVDLSYPLIDPRMRTKRALG